MDVAFAIEGRAYARHARVLLASLLAQPALRVHVLHSWRLSPASRWGLRDRRVRFHRVPDRVVAGLPAAGGYTQAMWFRCLLPALLPQAERCLYLDVDTLVLDDLAPLAALDLSDHWLAAVTNVPMAIHEGRAERWGVRDEDYFNSGVLLLHLHQLRHDGAMPEVLAFAREHPDLGWPDQDALNVVLGARRLPLHPRFNVMNSVVRFPSAAALLGEAEVAEARARPAIRHFEGPGHNKPWDAMADPADAALWASFGPARVRS